MTVIINILKHFHAGSLQLTEQDTEAKDSPKKQADDKEEARNAVKKHGGFVSKDGTVHVGRVKIAATEEEEHPRYDRTFIPLHRPVSEEERIAKEKKHGIKHK